MKKPQYTKDEKIEYFKHKIMNLRYELTKAERRLTQLTEELSGDEDMHQDWSERLTDQIKRVRKAR